MIKTCLITFVLVVGLSLGLLAQPMVAVASAGAPPIRGTPTSPFLTSTTVKPAAWRMLEDPKYYPNLTATDAAAGLTHADIDPVLNSVRVGGGVLPTLPQMVRNGTPVANSGTNFFNSTNDSITLGTVGRSLAIGMAITAGQIAGSGYEELFHLLIGDYGTTGNNSTVSGTTNWIAAPVKWCHHAAGDVMLTNGCMGSTGQIGYVAPATGWYLNTKVCSWITGGSPCTPSAAWAQCDGMGGTFNPGEKLWVAIVTGAPTLNAGGYLQGVQVAANPNCWYPYVTDANMERVTTRKPITETVYNNYGDKLSVPPQTNTEDSTAGAAALGATGSQTDAQKAAESAWAEGYTAGQGATNFAEPFLLPAPESNETYSDYAARLRDLGYLGSIVYTVDPMGYTSGSAGATLTEKIVTGVSVGTMGGLGTVYLYDPTTGVKQDWPSTAPLVVPGSTTEIDIQKVPGGYDPGAHGGTTGGVPGVDFTPITGIALGCKFPFGFICYAKDVTTVFNVSPVAPRFDISGFKKPALTWGANGTISSHYDVNLTAFDSYMTTFRSLVSWALWIGAVYVLATKLLGFKPGGDPGEAVDDVL